jgi:hypothetical protein
MCGPSTNPFPMDKPNKATSGNATWSHNNEAVLIHMLKKAKEEGKWGDNNPKAAVWTVCVLALSGSEKVLGGGPKDAKVVRRR